MSMSTLLLATGVTGGHLCTHSAKFISKLHLATRCLSASTLPPRLAVPAATTAFRRAHGFGSRPPAPPTFQRYSSPASVRHLSSSSSIRSGSEKGSTATAAAVAAEPTDALAHYEGPLTSTFTRLKMFSLGSLALASTLTPVLLLAPGEISMAGRVGLCLTALSTSGVSTALIAWIGQPYAGRMQLLAKGADANPRIRLETVSWTLRPIVTTVFEPSFIRATSRPFATWEITNAPPPLAVSSDAGGATKEVVTKIVSETVDVKSGKVIGRWIAKYDPLPLTKTDEGWKMQGRSEVEGKPVRYFNVHEELLDDDWRVLG